MKIAHKLFASGLSVVTTVTFIPTVHATEPASDADKSFVAHVSQGGMYEVQASKLAMKRASAPDLQDQAATEVHDHEGVNEQLKRIAEASGISVSSNLNDEFKKRLEKLDSASQKDFDAAYLQDMKEIHDKDEKLFAKEAEEGSESFRTFAHDTDRIVKRHIGSLQAAN